MDFINEYASEEDIKKYDLLNSWRRSLKKPHWLPTLGHKYQWTIDRARNTYLGLLSVPGDIGPSGRDEPTMLRVFLLKIDQEEIILTLEIISVEKVVAENLKFRTVWSLVDMSYIGNSILVRSKVIEILKAALCVYGNSGIRTEKYSQVIDFNF